MIGVAGIACAAIFVRLALPAPPVAVGFHRMAIATLLIAGFVAVRRGRRPDSRSAWLALVAGVAFGTDLALWNTAVVETSVATATLLVNTTPVIVGAWAVLVEKRKLDRRFAGGVALALSGCGVLLGLPTLAGSERSGALLALGAAVFYAGYLLLMTAARRGIDAAPALLLSSAGATCALGSYAWLRGDAFTGYPASSWVAIVALAVVSQLGGVLAIVWALRFLPTTLASVSLLGQPVGTALLGWWWLDEVISPLQAVGGVAVLAGIGLAARADTPRRAPR